jgi:hypothetical protein
MLCDDSGRALKVLNLVPTIPTELLQLHRAEALLAFQRLQTVVEHNDKSRNPGGPEYYTSPPTDRHRSHLHPLEGFASSSCLPVTKTVSSLTFPPNASIDARSQSVHSQDSISSIRQTSTPPSTPASSGSHESAPTPTSTVDLIEALDRDATAIKEFLSKPETIATNDELNRANGDPRVVDLRLAVGPPSQKAKFRKILSERSLASEFGDWEFQMHGSRRVEELVMHHTYAQEKTKGHINQYLQCNTHRFIDKHLTGKGIVRGIKLLVFEKMVGTSGISAILSFGNTKFRAVKYGELASLREMVDKSKWIKALAQRKAAWLDGCQVKYDGM